MGRLFQFLWKVGLLLSDDPRLAGYDRTTPPVRVTKYYYSFALLIPNTFVDIYLQ
jgi:hypothetical protein